MWDSIAVIGNTDCELLPWLVSANGGSSQVCSYNLRPLDWGIFAYYDVLSRILSCESHL